MNTYLGFCSAQVDATSLKNRSKYNILESEGIEQVYVLPLYSNTQSIAKCYNTYIKKYSAEDCILVLAHDDVLITDKNWIDKLKQAFKTYDVVGLAGGINPKIQGPALWHLMCSKEDLKGSVNHVDYGNNSTFNTNFGKNGRVALLDGLFLAFNPKKIFEAGVNFDETCPAKFHFYDLDFSLQCNKAKLKLGTTNIGVTHASPGLHSFTDEFKIGQDWFINKARTGQY